MKQLVALDWGTSSLRAALLDGQGHVLQERSLARGIMTVAPGEFPAVFDAACGDWMREAGLALVCGMAGSRQGWMEAPYCQCPAGFPDLLRQLAWVEPGRIAIVPGLVCEHDGVPDVVRGEETQVFGAMELLGVRDALVVLPGTHSKWVQLDQGRIARFSTFMTGELYALLRQHSILARGMPAQDGALDEAAFLQGIAHARRCANLLQSAFSARTLGLFERLAPHALASYLSGLVIGEELRAQPLAALRGPLILVGSAELQRRYSLALRTWDVAAHCVGSEAAWRGLWAIAQTLERHP